MAGYDGVDYTFQGIGSQKNRLVEVLYENLLDLTFTIQRQTKGWSTYGDKNEVNMII